jgi:hypothetical protein
VCAYWVGMNGQKNDVAAGCIELIR